MVADGVGSWEKEGHDAGLYSKKLVADVKIKYDSNPKQTLKKVLVESVAQNKYTGSTTVTMAKFDAAFPTKSIKTANLRDSGYQILRIGERKRVERLFKSRVQEREFNFPYQCGTNHEDEE